MEFNDEYNHIIEGILYFSRNLPTKEAEELYHNIAEGCYCTEKCIKESCVCIKKSGTIYEYDNISNFEAYEIKHKDHNPTYECNNSCKCSEKICGNKLVQFGPRKGLEVKLCKNINKGYGLFTVNKINKDNFICEYAGEVLTEQEAKNRFEINKKFNKMNYIFCINENFGDRILKTFIDPTVYGNIGRYINHSCRPNSKLVVVRENGTMPVLGVFSKKDIEVGDEITYKYGEDSSVEECNIQKPCLCGEDGCKKYLPYDSTLK